MYLFTIAHWLVLRDQVSQRFFLVRGKATVKRKVGERRCRTKADQRRNVPDKSERQPESRNTTPFLDNLSEAPRLPSSFVIGLPNDSGMGFPSWPPCIQNVSHIQCFLRCFMYRPRPANH